MDINNQTHVTSFLFSGPTDNEKMVPFLFTLFLVVYTVTVVGSIGMIAIVHCTSTLHSPMYYFLSSLSMVDLCYSSVVTPRCFPTCFPLFNGWALQLFFFASLAVTAALLLFSMSYDRYVAVCHPLHNVLIMNWRQCLGLVLLATFIGFLQAAAQTGCVFHLRFCGLSLLEHFCDMLPLLKVSCLGTHRCDILAVFFTWFCGVGSMVTILVPC